MKVFITGASGFVGSNIVTRLADKHQFYAMARSEKSAEKIKALGAVPIICELGEVTIDNLKDCEMIIHAAAFTRDWGSKEEIWKATVNGTRQLLEVAKKAGIKRFIHISTEALLFVGQDLNNIDESYPYPAKSEFLYSESKLESEKLALNANADNLFEVSVIRPRFVWGPGDQTVLPILVDMVERNKFMWINDGKNMTSHTHIYNLVEGVSCLIDNWKSNQIYFITDNEIHSYKEFLTKYLSSQGVTPPNKNINKSMIRFIADAFEFIWKVFGLKSAPPVTRLAAYMMSSNFTIRHSKATKEIKYNPIIGFDEAIKNLNAKKSNR